MLVHTYSWWAVYFLSRFILASDVDVDDKNKKNNKSDADSEIFADVIKNISRVNNVLQELITNYEHLQQLYKSEEELGSEYNSNSDSDERATKKANKNERSLVTNSATPDKYMAATEMIWSDDNHADNDNDNDDDETNESTDSSENQIIEKNTPKIESWQMATKKKKLVAKQETSSSSDDDTKDMSKEKSIEKSTEKSKKKNKEKSIEKKDDSSDSSDGPIKAESSQEAKIIFVDTHKKRLHKLGSSVKPTILPKPQILESVSKVKTRYVVKEPSFPEKYKENDIDPGTFLREGDNNSKHGIKNVVYTEKFSKNIWDEIINNKPIQLEKEKVVTYDNDMNRINNATAVSLRSNNVKNALVIVTDNNKKKKHKVSKSDISDEEEAINKDMFKTNILRKAYGDACLKLVVRKCFKACKAVGKRACSRFKCKGRFKALFKENAKTGCLKYFRNVEPNTTVNYRGKHDSSEEGGEGFVDVTRGGYLAAACWPHASEPPLALRNNTPFSLSLGPDKELNILRDKYEKACQRISREKCVSACNYAHTTSCTGNECSARLTKTFESGCKSQCKLAYTAEKESTAESEASTSSSSSESESSSSF